jgi:hypothetical protein
MAETLSSSPSSEEEEDGAWKRENTEDFVAGCWGLAACLFFGLALLPPFFSSYSDSSDSSLAAFSCYYLAGLPLTFLPPRMAEGGS